VERSGGDSIISDLVLKLLDPFAEQFGGWRTEYNNISLPWIHLPSWKFAPGVEATMTLAYLGCFDSKIAADVFATTKSRYSNPKNATQKRH
jgi:hypothetical protein